MKRSMRPLSIDGLLLVLGGCLGYGVILTVNSKVTSPNGTEEAKVASALQMGEGLRRSTLYERRLRQLQTLRSATTGDAFRQALQGEQTKHYQIWSQWASRDPAGFLAYGVAQRDPQMIRNAMDVLVARDPDEAERLALAITDGRTRRMAVTALIFHGFSQDPTMGRAFLLRHHAMLEPSDALLPLEMPAFAEALSALPDSYFTQEMADRVASRWAASDAEAAASWAKQLPSGETRRRALRQAFSKLVQEDTGAAAQLLEDAARLEPDFRPWGSSLAPLMKERLLDDPQGTMDWLSRFAGLGERTQTIERAFAQLAKDDLEGAHKVLASLPLSLRDAGTHAVATIMAETDPGHAFEWMVAQPGGQQWQRRLESIALKWVKEDAETVIATLAQLSDDERTLKPLAMALVNDLDQWPTPADAVDFAYSLPESMRAAAITEGMQAWSAQQPEAALRHTVSLPEGKERREALYQAGANLLRSNADEAMAFFQTLTSPEDLRAARTAIRVAAPSEAARERLLKALPEMEND